eukprot:Sdes_comp19892_c0_seq7m12232
MISSRKFPNEWILPKGGLEMNETLEQAVLRECWEESGAVAQVVKGLGCQLVKRKNPSCFHSFLLNVTSLVENWPEQNERSRKWVKQIIDGFVFQSIKLSFIFFSYSLPWMNQSMFARERR